MSDHSPTPARTRAIHRHLAENAAYCAKRGIHIHVDSINAGASYALCIVEQRSRRFFRRHYSEMELLWRAEQALVPLIGLGISPLITVRNNERLKTNASDTVSISRASMDGLAAIATYLGLTRSNEGFSPLMNKRDPFGWKGALAVSNAV